VVEIDSYAFHSSRRAFERDRRKQAELQGLGFEVLRFTWRQITQQPEWVVAQIASRLAARASYFKNPS
jgi:very-short-patch-repair endonuclease